MLALMALTHRLRHRQTLRASDSSRLEISSREESRPVALPSLKGLDQQGCGARSGGGQLVNHPEDTVHAKPLVGDDSAELGVTR